MNGMRADGQAVTHARREAPRRNRGRLAKHQVSELQTLIAKGLVSQGFTRDQVAQVIGTSPRTADRRLEFLSHEITPEPI